ncbi:MAG: TonB family protein [Bacteroidia bacterium]|nr:TonB family protein [Bacteroidia bacterium]
MRLSILLLLICYTCSAWGQEDKIYQFVQDKPILLLCELEPIAPSDKKACSEQRLLRYVTQNIIYPEQALADSIEGTVVVRFVVNKLGFVEDAEVLKDIGGGCGSAALAIMDSIRADSVQWRPAILDSAFVNSYVTLPIRFKFPRSYDYQVVREDTIYTVIDTPVDYKGGEIGFNMYVQNNLIYPKSGIDSCLVGDIGVELLVSADGKSKILDLLDYNKLGIDFEFQTIRMLNNTQQEWIPAVRKEVKVPSLYNARVTFIPPGDRCDEKVNVYNKAFDIARVANGHYLNGAYQEAVDNYSKAIDLVPNNVEYIYKRGLAYVELEMYAEACADIFLAKEHLVYTSMDALLPLLCKE